MIGVDLLLISSVTVADPQPYYSALMSRGSFHTKVGGRPDLSPALSEVGAEQFSAIMRTYPGQVDLDVRSRDEALFAQGTTRAPTSERSARDQGGSPSQPRGGTVMTEVDGSTEDLATPRPVADTRCPEHGEPVLDGPVM